MSLREKILLKTRHKWFSQHEADESWYGPWNTIEAALLEAASEWSEDAPIRIAQGRKLTKYEIEEWGPDYLWEVDAANAFIVHLPISFFKKTTTPAPLTAEE